MTDAELDLAYRSRGSLPPAERAAVERAHAEMVARYNSEWGTPDNVAANLDAAASPVMPDPVVGTPVRRPVTPKPSGPGAAPATMLDSTKLPPIVTAPIVEALASSPDA